MINVSCSTFAFLLHQLTDYHTPFPVFTSSSESFVCTDTLTSTSGAQHNDFSALLSPPAAASIKTNNKFVVLLDINIKLKQFYVKLFNRWQLTFLNKLFRLSHNLEMIGFLGNWSSHNLLCVHRTIKLHSVTVCSLVNMTDDQFNHFDCPLPP